MDTFFLQACNVGVFLSPLAAEFVRISAIFYQQMQDRLPADSNTKNDFVPENAQRNLNSSMGVFTGAITEHRSQEQIYNVLVFLLTLPTQPIANAEGWYGQ